MSFAESMSKNIGKIISKILSSKYSQKQIANAAVVPADTSNANKKVIFKNCTHLLIA